MSHFLNIEEQIDKLSLQKGLIIADRDYARRVLSSIGYFSLVTSYKTPFKNPDGKYARGTRLEDLVALYKTDENLRDLHLKYILRIESRLETLVAYYFCLKFGEDQSAYLNPDTYIYPKDMKRDVLYLVKNLRYVATKSRERAYIIQERKTGNVPLWIAIKAVSLGSLAKMYSFLPHEIRIQVARHFNGTDPDTFCRMLSLLSDFRNTCAHGDPFYNHKVYNKHARTSRTNRNDVAALSAVLERLLEEPDYVKYGSSLESIIANFERQCRVLTGQRLMELMGF